MQILLGIIGVVIAILLAGVSFAADAPLVTQPFRDEHKELREHLEHMQAMAANVRTDAEPGRAMQQLVSALKGHIEPHAAWEEQVLYPVVDRYAGAADEPVFTKSMRHEHRIVGREIAELADLASNPAANRAAYASKAEQLLGLIIAHFEVEEEVLLPVLARTCQRRISRLRSSKRCTNTNPQGQHQGRPAGRP